MSVQFTQSCPTCGRRLQVRASLLGYTVACQHCHAEFVATAEPNHVVPTPESSSPQVDPLMQRVERVLARANRESAVS